MRDQDTLEQSTWHSMLTAACVINHPPPETPTPTHNAPAQCKRHCRQHAQQWRGRSHIRIERPHLHEQPIPLCPSKHTLAVLAVGPRPPWVRGARVYDCHSACPKLQAHIDVLSAACEGTWACGLLWPRRACGFVCVGALQRSKSTATVCLMWHTHVAVCATRDQSMTMARCSPPATRGCGTHHRCGLPFLGKRKRTSLCLYATLAVMAHGTASPPHSPGVSQNSMAPVV